MDTCDISRYDGLAKMSVDSFKNFHPDIDLHYVNNDNWGEYYEKYYKTYDLYNFIGIVRWCLAYDLMVKFKYDKIILLGCDTITCSRLDEFINNNEDDVLATLNYWIHESTEYWSTPITEVTLPNGNKEIDHLNINADVVCFNNPDALKKVIDLSIEHFTHFGEQGALNELAWVDKSYTVKIVDSPYPLSKVSYNCRAKGVPRCDMIEKGVLKNCWPHNIHGFPHEWLVSQNLLDNLPSPIKSWYVKDNKLFTHDHKQIKVFHFVEGLGGRSIEKFNEFIDDFKNHWFNEETIKFFQEQCKCTQFFKKSND
tara:strand:- start:412 stop:1344 length:933 start_codon:yes stop_codon:yes gene_type:complete